MLIIMFIFQLNRFVHMYYILYNLFLLVVYYKASSWFMRDIAVCFVGYKTVIARYLKLANLHTHKIGNICMYLCNITICLFCTLLVLACFPISFPVEVGYFLKAFPYGITFILKYVFICITLIRLFARQNRVHWKLFCWIIV